MFVIRIFSYYFWCAIATWRLLSPALLYYIVRRRSILLYSILFYSFDLNTIHIVDIYIYKFEKGFDKGPKTLSNAYLRV